MESACQEIILLAEKVMDGGQITPEEAGRLIRTKDEDTMLLLAMADKIRQKFGGSSVDFCAIINARSGHCQEDCKFCAQSGWYRTGAKVYRLLPEEQQRPDEVEKELERIWQERLFAGGLRHRCAANKIGGYAHQKVQHRPDDWKQRRRRGKLPCCPW